MKTTEEYLARILKEMEAFQHTKFTSTEAQDAALTSLLGMRERILSEMKENCVTTPNYWECDCKDVYLHPKTEGHPDATICIDCDVTHDQASDAILYDVLQNLMKEEYLTK